MADSRRQASRRARLDQPVPARRGLLPQYDSDMFGRFSERIARFLGTARFLVYMTVFILAWIILNVTPFAFDPYTFTFLTLLLSLQASYAAPLILLAQNRQTDRDRVAQEEDRAQNTRLQADVEYLTREVASLRQSLGEVPTREFLREQLREVAEEVVARTSEGAGAVLYDKESRARREERERRAERKKRRQDKHPDDAAPTLTGLGDPFVGEHRS